MHSMDEPVVDTQVDASAAGRIEYGPEGFDVRVVERKASFCRAGAAVFIWPHGMQNLLTICPEACEQVRSALHREDLPIPIV